MLTPPNSTKATGMRVLFLPFDLIHYEIEKEQNDISFFAMLTLLYITFGRAEFDRRAREWTQKHAM